MKITTQKLKLKPFQYLNITELLVLKSNLNTNCYISCLCVQNNIKLAKSH